MCKPVPILVLLAFCIPCVRFGQSLEIKNQGTRPGHMARDGEPIAQEEPPEPDYDALARAPECRSASSQPGEEAERNLHKPRLMVQPTFLEEVASLEFPPTRAGSWAWGNRGQDVRSSTGLAIRELDPRCSRARRVVLPDGTYILTLSLNGSRAS